MLIRPMKIATAAVLAFCGLAAFAADRLDPILEAAAKCAAKEPIAPSMAAYRLLLSSKVVVKERQGPMTFYIAGVDPDAQVKLWNMSPTRIIVIEREGQPNALIGSLYSSSFPMSNANIIGSFQGGLGVKIELRPLAGALLDNFGVSNGMISTKPVAKDSHIFMGILASGERLVVCGTKAELESFIK